MAADDHLVILAASAAGMHRNQVLSGRQIAVVHKLNPARIGMKNLGFHYRLIAALRAPLNPNTLFRILRIYLYVATGRGEVMSS